jgi:hypothetical protein
MLLQWAMVVVLPTVVAAAAAARGPITDSLGDSSLPMRTGAVDDAAVAAVEGRQSNSPGDLSGSLGLLPDEARSMLLHRGADLEELERFVHAAHKEVVDNDDDGRAAAAGGIAGGSDGRRRAQSADYRTSAGEPHLNRYTDGERDVWTGRLMDNNEVPGVLATLPDGSSLLPMESPAESLRSCLGAGGLRDFYFDDPDASDPKVRCFTYDPTATGEKRWPSNGGVGDSRDLFDEEYYSSRLDWHELLPATGSVSGANPTPVEFMVGQGAACTEVYTAYTAEFDVGSNTQDLNVTETRLACVFAGLHETNHSHLRIGDDVEEGFQPVDNGTFVLGACTDYLIRVVTDEVSADATVVWHLDDVGMGDAESHMGPWEHAHQPAAGGTEEFTTCLFDNNFTLTRTSAADDGWVGTIQVVGYIPDNSIYSE